VRGSQHAWDIRLISVDSLVQLVFTKESADSADTAAKIRRLLTPLEYTRLDDLVEIVFSAAQDVEQAVAADNPSAVDDSSSESEGSSGYVFTPQVQIREIRENV